MQEKVYMARPVLLETWLLLSDRVRKVELWKKTKLSGCDGTVAD